MPNVVASIRPLLMTLVAWPAFAVAAQQAPNSEQSDDSIIVTGERTERERVREQAQRFVQATGVASGQVPAARWIDPVCPRVLGIHESYGRIVEARIRTVAREANIALAAEGCRTNLIIAFAWDASDLAREVNRLRPRAMTEIPFHRRDALLDGPAPVRWWYTTIERSENLPSVSSEESSAIGNVNLGVPMFSGMPGFHHYRSSLISTQAVRAIRTASVLVDMQRAEGMSLEAVANYAAFVALAEIRPTEPAPQPSILSLFGAERDRTSLSNWDQAFLRGLYRLPLARIARQHRGALRKSLIQADSDGEETP